MQTKTNLRKLLPLLLVLAMLLSILPMGTMAAANVASLTGFGKSVGSIAISGADITEYDYAVSTNSAGKVYDYYLAVNDNTASGTTVTATFTKSADVADGCAISPVPGLMNPPQGPQIIAASERMTYETTFEEGSGTATAYVHHDISIAGTSWPHYGEYDTYVFHYAQSKPISISTGDPVFIIWSGNSGTVAGRGGASAIPGSFTLWVEGATSITVNGAVQAYEYSDSNNYAYTITTGASDTTMTAISGGTPYTITCPPKTFTPAGSAPTSVVSYLPIGQYAGGSGWGSSAGKFVGKTSLDSTGVSLGALGGYIEFYFAGGIENDPSNPYGVDFVVYGNAFNGNPEAGAVQVSEDGTTWYELAGSKYYDGDFSFDASKIANNKYSNVYTGTLNDTTVAYTLGSDIQAVLGGYGPYTFTNATSWWPLTSEGYPMGTPHTDANVTVSHSNTSLTFGGITAVQDSNVTADYAFGYADVTPNGSPSVYGAAVNPYSPYTTSKTGGDGFDLEWAVDIATGLPVDVSGWTFHYVRVYSCVLDNAVFGETSPEICGIFTAVGDTGSIASSDLEVWGAFEVTTQNGQAVSVAARSYTVYSTEENVFVNGNRVDASGDNGYTFNIRSGEKVRIITQSGAKAPYITLLTCA